MVFVILSNYLLLLSIFGYSFLYKKFLFKEKEFKISNIEILYGLIIILFLSLIINFFFPLKYFSLTIVILGIIIFIYGLYKKIYKINFIYYFFIILFISYISFYAGDNIDSPMYHLQILKWLMSEKISFGLANLEIRFGFNSSWHSIIALLNLSYDKFNSKYYLSAIILSTLIYETVKYRKNIEYSHILLFLVTTFLLIFSIAHPFRNGVILNQLGNPERDIANMIFFFFSIYIFLKIVEKNYDDKNLINLLIASTFFCLTTRLTMAPIILILFFTLYKSKNYKLINFNTIFLSIISFFWLIRSFFLSGCLFFPVSKTCIQTPWSVNIEEIVSIVNQAMSYAKTLPSLHRFNDYEYTLNSYQWVVPWFKNYFLEAALLQIGTVIILLSIFLILISKFLKFKIKIKNSDYFLLLILILTLFFWFKAPEIRFGWGPLIILPCLFAIISLKKIDFLSKFTQINKIISLISIILLFSFTSKSIKYFKSDELFITSKKSYDFSFIKKIGNFGGKDIYNCEWRGADYPNICVNTIKENYDIKVKSSYLFFKSY